MSFLSLSTPLSENEEIAHATVTDSWEFVLLQGYLSFWNENISYALRGCIVIELALRGRISMQKDSSRRRFPLADRVIEVVDDTLTGEVLLDEALKMMKSSEKMSVNEWIDLMSGTSIFSHCWELKRALTRQSR